MYTNENAHRFPALVLAACFTTAVVIGLSALAPSTVAMPASELRQVVATTPFTQQDAVVEALITPFRIEVVASRS